MEKDAKVIGYKFIKAHSPMDDSWEEMLKKACPDIETFYYDILPCRNKWSRQISIKKILEEVKRGRVRKIVVAKLSDVSRNPTEVLTFIKMLKKYKVEFYCIAEQVTFIDNSMWKILEELAVQEKRIKRLLIKQRNPSGCRE